MKFLLTTITLLLNLLTHAQETPSDYPHDIPLPYYVKLDSNKIEFFGDSSKFFPIFKTLSNFLTTGQGHLSVVHFGGSHLQADIYTQEFRTKMNQYFDNIITSRGLVFPYNIAETNNPVPYTSHFTGHWETYRNVEKNNPYKLGLLGIVASTTDTISSFSIYGRKTEPSLHFNMAKIFYNKAYTGFRIYPMQDSTQYTLFNDTSKGIYTIHYAEQQDTFQLKIIRTDTVCTPFDLCGISLENVNENMIYHTIGINGASIPSFLKCQLLTEQLKEIHPDLAVMSLGTNDAYQRQFDPMVYYHNLDTLIHTFWKANPDMAIILTVPNDNYLYRRYPNENTDKQEKVIYDLAKKYHLAVWNLYKIMGGFKSSQQWYKDGLMKRDRIHFTNKGYELKGDMYFSAFLKAWENFAVNKKDSL